MLYRRLLRTSWNEWLSTDPRPPTTPWWMQWMWTVLLSLLIAVAFTIFGFAVYGSGGGAWRNLAGWWHWYQLNAWVSLWIGGTIHMLFMIGTWWLRRAGVRRLQGWARPAFYTGIPLVGVLIAWPTSIWLLGGTVRNWFSGDSANVWIGMLLIAVLVNLVIQQMFAAKARQVESERRATEAQLQLLQAQIEPHFLFNTLANVLSLIESDAPRARRMLESFTDYLRSSLGGLRRNDVSLAEELTLATAYLQVQQLRMDDRLRFTIEADAEARAARLPPLLVQPLVENAIHHGLEPKVEGGSVRLRARREGDRLVIEVDDDGLGLTESGRARPGTPSNGVALDNLRERLVSRFGGAGSLSLQRLSPGTRCRLELPYDTSPAVRSSPAAAAPGIVAVQPADREQVA